jgi:predicted phosphoribosyltransferase
LESTLITEESYRNRIHVFTDRRDAGRKLADTLSDYTDTDTIVLAIPSGGVPVALEISKSLRLQLDLILVRKVQIPWNTEAGFGALDPDGEVTLNQELLGRLGLSSDEIELQIRKTKDTLKKRDQLFRKGKPFPNVRDRTVIVADDGLASGYTMFTALEFIKKRVPKKVLVAVPTGSERAVELMLRKAVSIACLNIRSGFTFAVADAYRNWYDLSDEEVLSLLRKA